MAVTTTDVSQRLYSLDALRGFDMFWIIGAEDIVQALHKISHTGPVNLLATQLTHKDWAGLAFYDTIFPLFVFIVGVSLVFSLGKTIEQQGRGAAYQRVLVRGILLYGIGILYYGGFSTTWDHIRLLGVLQRIALCYFFAGLIFCTFRLRGMIACCAVLLVGYWALMTFVSVPGVGAGHFEEGKNLANYVDQQYLPFRKWDGDHDPEGLLSTLPAIATCLLGVFAGLLLRNQAIPNQRKVIFLVAGGCACLLVGSLWSLQFPVIKKIWTSSYVLVAGGYSAILLGLFYWVVDVLEFRGWCRPFIWMGMNSITVYLASNLMGGGGWVRLGNRFAGGDVRHFLDGHLAPGAGEMTIALVGLALAFWFCHFLYKRKIFLRL
jgi:predicted acyltransferase